MIKKKITVQRQSCPVFIQQLWDAVNWVCLQRQIPVAERISRYMLKMHQIEAEEVTSQLNKGVTDELLSFVKRVGCKGTKTGVEQDSYRTPKNTPVRNDHDWYCFTCHKEGEVVLCSSCWRVFHPACIKSEENGNTCYFCQVENDTSFNITRKDLNTLLVFTCMRIKRKMDSINLTLENEESWRMSQLVYSPIDVQDMEKKCSKGLYKSLGEFEADAHLILHNVALLHGVCSASGRVCELMVGDVMYDLTEIKSCKDCYRMSNLRNKKNWFCRPCEPPHRLVYAKQRGFPYWPAKVIRVTEDGNYDVRFFGGFHQRAVIDKNHVKDVKVNIRTLQIKRTSAWNKAAEELKIHQQLLEQSARNSDALSEVEKYESPILVAEAVVKLRDIRKDQVTKGIITEEQDEEEEMKKDEIEIRTPDVTMTERMQEEEQVTSSSQIQSTRTIGVQTPAKMRKIDNKGRETDLKELLEKQRKDLELERRNHENKVKQQLKEMEDMKKQHEQNVAENKKKQWCYNCEAEAIYHCCWNTAYCSIDCQQGHWQKEHKRSCRRKR